MKIEIKNCELTISGDTDTLNALLKPHGLHIAPLPAPAPPPQTEAERLVGIARSLPREATTGWDRMADCNVDSDGDIWVGDGCYFATTFRTILLGVMAAYVGTEEGARVQCVGGVFYWYSGDKDCKPFGRPEEWGFGNTKDLLTAYRDCCLAIARKRGGA